MNDDQFETKASLWYQRETLERSTMENIATTFVWICCVFHSTCSMQRHKTKIPDGRSLTWHWWWSNCVCASMFLDRGAECSCFLRDWIMLRLQFLCPWSTYFHRSLPISCLQWERLISYQGVQRLVFHLTTKMMMHQLVMNQRILWIMTINLVTALDQIQAIMMIKRTSFQISR